MKRLLIMMFIFLILFSSTSVTVSAENGLKLAEKAKSAILVEASTGKILFEKNADEKLHPASMTKMMSMLLIIEAIENGIIKWDQVVQVSENASSMGGSQILLETGEKMSVRDLFKGVAIASGNDAVVALAETVAGNVSNFVSMMNKRSSELGLTNTNFKNPHGLDEYTKNYSTAYDMALLSSYANNNQIYKKIVSTEKYECSTKNKTYLWYNRNKLLFNYEFCTGGKNGYTPSAGKSLVSTAKKGNLSITIVSLNDNDIYTTHESLYEELFSNYKKYKIVDKKTFNIDKKLFASPVYLKKSFFYPLTEREIDKIKTFIYLENFSKNKVGNIEIFLKDEKIGSLPIFLKKEKKENFSFLKLIHNLF